MADDLTESIVRQHLRDQPGEVHCARCLARVLNLDLSATEAVLVALAERRPHSLRVSAVATTPDSRSCCNSSSRSLPPYRPQHLLLRSVVLAYSSRPSL
jgi:hypothetical protein